MKFSYNWLRELVDGLDVPAAELGRLVTMKTAECEGVEAAAAVPGCEPDSVIEIDNKSITHRPDLWGHHGLAREVAAILRRGLRDPVEPDRIPGGSGAIGVEIEDLALCPRYSALTFENVTVGPSPPWLQCRLETIGLNPINNIVDVTNYVMAEIAQPMHAFDWDLLRGPTIYVRTARPGERILALNEQEYQLDARDLVIADERGPVALAGVIGGLDSSIGGRTRRIVLESANFQASSVRKTSSRQKLRTDASMRFEKAQDPVNTVRGLARAVELLELVCPGIRLSGGLADQGGPLPPLPPISVSLDWLVRKLGRPLEIAEVREILERLAFGVSEKAPGVLSVTVPSWRATRDVSIKDDILEEVGRMVGYDSITPAPPSLPVVPPPRNEGRLFHQGVRSTLTGLGFAEVHNYSFNNEEQVRAFGFDPADHIAVTNPISSEQGLLRTSLLPEIRKNVEENSRHFENFRLFEIGREIHKQPEGLPVEITHLAAAVYRREDGQAGLMELKRAAEHLMPGCEVRSADARPFEHPVRVAEVHWRGSLMGRLFELHPSLIAGRAAVLDVDLDLLRKLAPQEKRYRPIRRFPSSAFDLSVLAGLREPVGDIRAKLAGLAGGEIEAIDFVRQYEGAPLPEGAKSVSFRLTVASSDRTLTSEEVSAIRARIIDGMRAMGYELRV